MRIVVVGGTGFFGRIIVDGLLRKAGFLVIAAGRRPPASGAGMAYAHLDVDSPDLPDRLRGLAPDLVIHCAGPFLPACDAVADAALRCGSHYLDLADDRQAVLGIRRFDSAARAAGLVFLSGVSSVPALSSAVVGQFAGEFSSLRCIDLGITTTERVPGIGTAASVLGQCGQTLGAPSNASAWGRRVVVRWPEPVGMRVMSYCDVPDLALLPERFPELERVTFCAGVPSPLIMWGLRRLSGLRRRGWLQPRRLARPLYRAARCLEPFGNGASGMFVRLAGVDADGNPGTVSWQLLARDNQGPRVPAQGAVSTACRLAEGTLAPGARPAFMLLNVDQYLADLPVTVQVERRGKPLYGHDTIPRW